MSFLRTVKMNIKYLHFGLFNVYFAVVKYIFIFTVTCKMEAFVV